MKKISLIASISSLLLCALYAQEKTVPNAGSVIQRAGAPDCVQITDDNKAMGQAVQEARKTIGKFIAAVRAPKNNQSRFAIKKPFIEGNKVEHLWVNEVTFDGKAFRGKVDNEPVDIKGVHPGDQVSVSPDEISDWMYVQDGRLIGGYTCRAMCRGFTPAQKKQFETDAHCRID